MKATLYVSAVKTPFDSDYSIRVSNENVNADVAMQEKKIGSFEVEIPAEIENVLAELLIDNLEDLILEAHKNHTSHVNDLYSKINLLNEKLAQ